MNGNDQDLRERFAALRRQEETKAPELAGLLRSRDLRIRRRSPFGLVAAAVCVAATVAAALWLGHASLNREFWNRHRERGTPVASITRWKSPTDFLLDTPGSEMLRSAPVLGGPQSAVNFLEPGNRNKHEKRRALP